LEPTLLQLLVLVPTANQKSMNGENVNGHIVDDEDDPYSSLEHDSEGTRRFVTEANKFCLTALGDPTQSPRYERILKYLQADDVIPFVSKMGSVNGDDELYNLWKDVKVGDRCSLLFLLHESFLG
jgi:hypothetical protein